MQNCLSDDELRRFRARTLSADDASRVSEHLAACAHCRERGEATVDYSVSAGDRDLPTKADASDGSGPTHTSPLEARATSAEFAGFLPLHIRGYRLLSELHRGGQGIVYQAIQESTHRKVAIKVPLDEADPFGIGRKRFDREVELVAQLQHPNIVSIFDSGVTADGRRYFVMDYIRGVPLRDYVRRNALSLEAALPLFGDVCHAVHHAHQRGIVHRDIKPSNVLVTHDGVVKVLDFGLAKSLTPADLTVVSTSGQFIGTLAYTSPEQMRGRGSDVDQRSDVYSLGVMLYELLTGRLPLTLTGELAAMVEQISHAQPVLPSVAWSGEFGIVRASDAAAGRVRNPIDADLETIVLKTLSKEPSRRYATADDLAADIDRYLAGEPIAARRDSVGYVLKTRVRRVSRRHRWTAFAVCLLVAITVANPVGVYVFYRLTGVNAWFERTMAQWAPLPERPRHLDDIRIIALTDDTDIGQIAEHEGLLDVNAREPRSLRRLHGRTMEKLASSSCKAVVWDVAFLGESPYDQSFVQGADALRDAGIPVIVAAQRWKLDADDKLGVSPAIAKADSVSVRCVAAGLDPSVPWRVQLCAKRGLDHPEPSLAIAAYAAFRMPRNQEVAPAFMLDATNRAVEVHYLRRGTRIRLGKPDRVLLTHLLPADDGSGAHASKYNLRPTDTVGLLRVDIADPADFEQITIEYVDVYTASTEQLRKQLDSRLVFFADLRTGVDRYGYAQRGELPGCYAHVAGVLTMLSASSIRDRGHKHKLELAQVFGAGLIGVALGARIARRSALRWLTLVLIALLLAAGSVAVFRVRGYLINPFPAMVSLACAAEFAAALARLVHSRID